MQVDQAMKLAKKHKSTGVMASSATLAFQDAQHLFERGLMEYAKKRALDSLRYSVGIFHTDYQKAAA